MLCWNHFLGDNFKQELPCSMKTINEFSFVIVNYLELLGFLIIWWLIRNIRNDLNIKMEVTVAIIFWALFSMIYFILSIVLKLTDTNKTIDSKEYKNNSTIIFTIILLRDYSVLFATTLFSLYMLIIKPHKTYPRLFEGKLIVLDSETALNSCTPFRFFTHFINTHSPKNLVHLRVYSIIRIYE